MYLLVLSHISANNIVSRLTAKCPLINQSCDSTFHVTKFTFGDCLMATYFQFNFLVHINYIITLRKMYKKADINLISSKRQSAYFQHYKTYLSQFRELQIHSENYLFLVCVRHTHEVLILGMQKSRLKDYLG